MIVAGKPYLDIGQPTFKTDGKSLLAIDIFSRQVRENAIQEAIEFKSNAGQPSRVLEFTTPCHK